MSTPPDRRSRKRLATREAISDVATRLFVERGFDKVTIDEIAAAADVGRMTVFNHFPRKEDLFFDRDGEVRALLREAILQRQAGSAPLEALRRHAHQLIAQKSPLVEFSKDSRDFVAAIAASEALKARTRAIRDEFAQVVAQALADSVQRQANDSEAQLAANLLLATWATALIHAHQLFRTTRKAKAAEAAFLALIDRGHDGLQAALAGTPYV
ncbi:transcriptional regulator, TetR family [Pseudoxanthomonas sp. GM95]|uniref:TetR/AcrR family transcriptional regulator n=1 Tax=Pseudoxanthomonas sp. GM95 TaxID=1881043 RepID=UPI0008D4DCE0|nr:TetR/AcrR family transcriptional regulator [Pseudoxanthomonas sp. GM95]SEM19769.1 transcriptional regulator, TetR family [Pseudoxanthomonas sp. GM95]